jgi:hypothetical protein
LTDVSADFLRVEDLVSMEPALAGDRPMCLPCGLLGCDGVRFGLGVFGFDRGRFGFCLGEFRFGLVGFGFVLEGVGFGREPLGPGVGTGRFSNWSSSCGVGGAV